MLNYGFMTLSDGVYWWRENKAPQEKGYGGPARGPYGNMEEAKEATQQDVKTRLP